MPPFSRLGNIIALRPAWVRLKRKNALKRQQPATNIEREMHMSQAGQSGIGRRNFMVGLAASAALAGFIQPEAALAAQSGGAKAAAPGIPSRERELTGPLLTDLEAEAKKALPPGSFAFISGGAEKGRTIKENVRAFDDWQLLPKYLSAQPAPDLRATLLGHELSLPVITTPMGAHGVAHASGELGTARGTAEAGTLMTVSTAANHSLA